MPDYFVPMDTTLFTKYHSRLSNKGVLLKVHFQLIDTHRDEWSKKYPDYATFNRKFELSDKMMKQLIAEGKVTNSLHYFAGDGSLKRRLRLAKNALGHIKRFNKYSKVPD